MVIKTTTIVTLFKLNTIFGACTLMLPLTFLFKTRRLHLFCLHFYPAYGLGPFGKTPTFMKGEREIGKGVFVPLPRYS